MAAVVPDHALGLSGGPGRVEDVQRIGGRHGHRLGGLHAVLSLGPGQPRGPARGLRALTGLGHRGGEAVPFVDQHRRRRVLADLQGLLDRGQVLDATLGLHASGRRDDGHRPGVVDAAGELPGCKASEDHGVHRPQSGARQHGHDRLGDHGHVEQHPVTLGDTLGRERAGEEGDLLLQLGVRDVLLHPEDRGVVDQGRALPVARGHVAVHRVDARVQLPVREPAVEGGCGVVQGSGGRGDPLHGVGGVQPEPLGIIHARAVDGFVGGLRHGVLRTWCWGGHRRTFMVVPCITPGKDCVYTMPAKPH